jgi:hypothetical protein
MPRLAAALAALLLAAGCGTGGTPASSQAAKDVHQRSVNAGIARAKAGRASSAADHARRVVGTAGSASIEVLEMTGTGIEGHVVLRIHSSYEASGFGSASSATACYRYDFADASGGTRPHEVDCGKRAALTLPAPAPVINLPDGTLERLTRALGSPAPASGVSAAFPEPGLVVQTLLLDGVLGAAVSAGKNGCVLGRRLADGQVEVWVVPRVLAQPGELGCSPETAARGQGKTPPH